MKCAIRARLGLAVASIVSLSPPGNALAQEASSRSDQFMRIEGTYYGANSCFQCHKQPTRLNYNRGDLDWCLLTEYSTWRTVDKHSMAYAVLEGPRGEGIGAKLRVEVTRPESGCLSCHAQNFPTQQLGPDFSHTDGVNCEVCHGPSGGTDGGWFGPHQTSDWRRRTPEEKAELGLWNLRDPEFQAQLYLSCHVGNAELGRVVSHPMYAAGHPPLPSIDVARFVKNLPQHWRDKDDVPWWRDAPEAIRQANGIEEAKRYGAELSMVGNVVALRESMNLLADRADLSNTAPMTLSAWPEIALNESIRNNPRFENAEEYPKLALTRWPEIALTHSDCLACHHDLRYPGWRQRRGFAFAPGRPMPRTFPIALIELNIDQFGDEVDRDKFHDRLCTLNEAFSSRPFGRPDEVRDAARGLAGWADSFNERRMSKASFDQDSVERLLRRLCELNQDSILDYDTARQVASALQIIYRDWDDGRDEQASTHDQIEKILMSWDVGLNLGRYPGSDARDALSHMILRNLAMDEELGGFGDWLPVTLDYSKAPESYWEASRQNPILMAFGPLLDPNQLRDAYMSDGFKESLQHINNEGLKITLSTANTYDPYQFREEIRSLMILIP
ncbi:hypothetical protein ElP_51230 [Tautonia plasticadhaerens]|uniref:Cytochrome c-552/4 domain-containing protein n=2 Tax=Tautonia plasticadhaerens TaxID=2527974 RepID=A0A518H8M2_9BACT|nr:hypothetical protein ElP_51230 [Tautonia plasticadhaerens]